MPYGNDGRADHFSPAESREQPKPKDKWKSENVSYNEFGGKAE